jgi:hypothetical protein
MFHAQQAISVKLYLFATKPSEEGCNSLSKQA